MRDSTTPKSKHQRSCYALAAILLLLSAALLYALGFLQIVPAPLLLLCYGLVAGSLFCGYQALARPFPGWAWIISITIMGLGYAVFVWLGVDWAVGAIQMLAGGAFFVWSYHVYLELKRRTGLPRVR